jgi:hypothetical protein
MSSNLFDSSFLGADQTWLLRVRLHSGSSRQIGQFDVIARMRQDEAPTRKLESLAEADVEERLVDALQMNDQVGQLLEELGIDIIGNGEDVCE